MLPESKITVKELCDWYLGLASVKRLASFKRLGYSLANTIGALGDRPCHSLKPVDIENYQAARITAGLKAVTVDYEVTTLKIVIKKAFDNDLIGGDVFKAFRGIKKISTRAERSRDRIITIDEYVGIIGKAARHTRDMLIVMYNTGMRPSEVRGLKWSYIDRKTGFIRLPAEETKERAPKAVPINHHVRKVLDTQPRHIDHDFVFTFRGNRSPGTRGLLMPSKQLAGGPACHAAKKPAGSPLTTFGGRSKRTAPGPGSTKYSGTP